METASSQAWFSLEYNDVVGWMAAALKWRNGAIERETTVTNDDFSPSQEPEQNNRGKEN